MTVHQAGISATNMAFLHLLLVCVGFHVACGYMYDDVVTLGQDMLKNYTRTVRPVRNQTTTTTVGIYVALRAIKDFNVVEGVLSSQMYIRMSWTDEFITWTPEKYGNVSSLYLPYTDVWVPPMVLFNPADDYDWMGSDKGQVLVKYTPGGVTELGVSVSVKSICEPFLRYFPFDTHSCDVLILHMFYGLGDIHPLARGAPDDYLLSNGQWYVQISSFSQEVLVNGHRYVKLTLSLTRRSYFLVANLFAPIIFLLGMNLFVFILPVESGEKASYSITVLLALAIFMTIVMDQLPSISTDPPIISVVLLFHLALNVLVCLCTLLSMKYYHKTNARLIPWYLRLLVTVVTVTRYASPDRVSDISDTRDKVKKENGANLPEEVVGAGEDTDTDQKLSLTWSLVSLAVDRLTLCVCLTGIAIEIIVLLCIFSS